MDQTATHGIRTDLISFYRLHLFRLLHSRSEKGEKARRKKDQTIPQIRNLVHKPNMTNIIHKILLVIMVSAIVIAVAMDDVTKKCRFANLFDLTSLITSPEQQHLLKMAVAQWEGRFAGTHLVGINVKSGLTYDGTGIDYDTGQPRESLLHHWSASSKESLHLSMMALALQGNGYAQVFMESAMRSSMPHMTDIPALHSGTRRGSICDFVLTILERKLSSYEKFDKRYPGFGGMLPWFKTTDEGMELLPPYWSDRIPSLDNSQLIWTLMVMRHTLSEFSKRSSGSSRDLYPENLSLSRRALGLMVRIDARLNLIRRSVLPIYYESDGLIRCVTQIADIRVSPLPNNRTNYARDGICSLNDPYEGELMAFYMDLYADWEAGSFNQSERDHIWTAKRPLLQAVLYKSRLGEITVERGWWYSSHEKWKYMLLPYTDVPINRRVFLNGEKARSIHSAESGIPGMFASVTDVSSPGEPDKVPKYLSACGIQSIASQQVMHHDVITPYGAYPLMLLGNSTEMHGYGLAWYVHMLKGPAMQGPMGSTDSINVKGTAISPVVTWDTKVTSVVAMLGGVSDIVRSIMIRDGTLHRFLHIVDREWSHVFSRELQGEQLPFLAPTVPIPHTNLSDFTTCS